MPSARRHDEPLCFKMWAEGNLPAALLNLRRRLLLRGWQRTAVGDPGEKLARGEIEHQPVLSGPLLDLVAPQKGETVVDATLGHGGHAQLLAEAIGETGRLIGFDVDPENLARTQARLEQATHAAGGPHLDLVQANFRELSGQLDALGVAGVDVLIADLGPSTDQLMDAQRGLSFAEDGPLDMRLDPRLSKTAMDLVNSMRQNELADLIYNLSQERFSRKIARQICQARKKQRIRRTSELVRIVCSALGAPPKGRAGQRIHPATRTFLALRMAVNRELDVLTELLTQLPERLNPGGRVGIISFHSGEDRLVKRDFLHRQKAGFYDIKTKKPITPSAEEVRRNPKARSAKLRVAVRTADQREAA